MFEPGVQAAMGGHAPRPDRQAHFAVSEVVTVVARQALDRLEIENFLIELGDIRRAAAAHANVIDPTRLFPAELNVAFADVVHAFLGKVPLIAVGIVAAQAGEWDMPRALRNINLRIRLLNPLAHEIDTLYGEAKMIEARPEAGLALQERQPDNAVAQVSAFFVVFASLVGHPIGNLLHAKNGLIKFRFTVPIFGHHRDVAYACKHGLYPSF